MPTPVEVHQFAPARPRLPAAPVAAPRAVLGQQPGFLQRRLDVCVGQRHPVLTARDLVEVPRVEPDVPLAIELQETLDLAEWRSPRRRPTPPTVEQAEVAITRKTPAPTPHTTRRAANNLRRLDPRDLPAHRAQHHLSNCHGPLQRRRRIEHAGPPGPLSDSPRLAQRTDHLLRKADRSCALYSKGFGPLARAGAFAVACPRPIQCQKA